jgi:hypothetical protein
MSVTPSVQCRLHRDNKRVAGLRKEVVEIAVLGSFLLDLRLQMKDFLACAAPDIFDAYLDVCDTRQFVLGASDPFCSFRLWEETRRDGR